MCLDMEVQLDVAVRVTVWYFTCHGSQEWLRMSLSCRNGKIKRTEKRTARPAN
jgi:hypothetical protein